MLSFNFIDKSSVVYIINYKLVFKYFGFYFIIVRVGMGCNLYIQLKCIKYFILFRKDVGSVSVFSILSEFNGVNQMSIVFLVILDKKIGKKGNNIIVYVLIYWFNVFKEEVIWEFDDEIEKRFSDFNI